MKKPCVSLVQQLNFKKQKKTKSAAFFPILWSGTSTRRVLLSRFFPFYSFEAFCVWCCCLVVNNISAACVWNVVRVGWVEVHRSPLFRCAMSIPDPILHQLIWKGHVNKFRKAVRDPHVDVNAVDEDGWTALLLACDKKNVVMVKALLARPDIEVNRKESKFGADSPLRHGCFNGWLEGVKLLSAHPTIDMNVQDNMGMTPLYAACSEGHADVLSFLIHDGRVDVMKSEEDGRTPLHAACQEGRLEVVKLLVGDERVDVNVKDEKGVTPLLLCSKNGHVDVVRFLLKHVTGVDRHTPSNIGYTCLMIASKKGHYDIVQLLVEKAPSAYIDQQDEEGATALMCAALKGHARILDLLLRMGANKELTHESGETALDVAKQEGHKDCIDLLDGTTPIKLFFFCQNSTCIGCRASYVCRGCWEVSYCCDECQKEDWKRKEEDGGHKAYCKRKMRENKEKEEEEEEEKE